VLPPFVAIAVRPRPGVWEYVRVNVHELSVEQLTVSEYLRFKEDLVDGQYVLLDPASLSSAFAFAGISSTRFILFYLFIIGGIIQWSVYLLLRL
jgi:hypothetical protein